MKLSFSTKIAIVTTLLSVGIATLSTLSFYFRTKNMVLEQMGSRLKDIGRTATHLIGEKEQKDIIDLKEKVHKAALPTYLVTEGIQPGQYRKSLPDEVSLELMKTKQFQNIVEILRKIKNSTKKHAPQYLKNNENDAPTLAYVTILTTTAASKDRKVLQFIADADYDDIEAPNPIGNLFYNNSDAIRNAFGGEVLSDEDFRLEEGQHLLSAGIPIVSKDQKVIAVLSLDYNASSEVNQVAKAWNFSVFVIATSLAISLLASICLARVFNIPIKKLREGAERVTTRDFSTQIILASDDELGLLAKAFNAMVSEIGTYAKNLEAYNAAYFRFVPKEFLDQLGQTDILNIKLGDQVQRQMTILFSDIRSFTTISESMSPRDNFDFINEYLGTVSPIIRKHGGFVDKYIGDAVMALFPDNVENAVKAALEMQQSLIEFNEIGKELGRPKVSIGIGLHKGNLMLGTVGEQLRMEGTVISDAVNLCSRLEGLTKDYGAQIILSERVYNAIAEFSTYHARYLGLVNVKGKKNSVGIYELFDSDDQDQIRRKIISIEDFENGVRLHEKGRYIRALKYFKRVLRVNRTDFAAKLFLDRTRKLIQESLPSSSKNKSKLTTLPKELKLKRGKDL